MAQTVSTMSLPSFGANLGMKARLMEGYTLLLLGQLNEAAQKIDSLIGGTGVPAELESKAKGLKDLLKERLFPFLEWSGTVEAKKIIQKVQSEGLRETIARQYAPLISWWNEMPEDAVPLLDVWGRGGFARIAAAVNCNPLKAICVDARSVEEIAYWARVFCPLFETVIIKWKGTLSPVLAMVPIPGDIGPPGHFGAQGYDILPEEKIKENWYLGVGWANFFPSVVTDFLAGEALSLFKAGRLVILPAPLVGCTQHAVGWTDNLLTENLFGGVINVVNSKNESEMISGEQRLIDLANVEIPFIDAISMGDLASVLDDNADLLEPLREILDQSIFSSDIRKEHWSKIRSLDRNIRQASRELNEKLKSLTKNKSGENWLIKKEINVFSAGSPTVEKPGSEPITQLLMSLTTNSDVITPWIPYWRLQNCGGHLDWTSRLDNPSYQPDPHARMQGFDRDDYQTWLYPGDGGPYLHTGVVVEGPII